MALEIRINTNAANAAVADLRKNITALGGDTKLSAAEIQKLEERLRKQMGADAAEAALKKLQQQTGANTEEFKRLAAQLSASQEQIDKLTKTQKDYAKSQQDATQSAGGFKDMLSKIGGVVPGIYGAIAGLASVYISFDFFKEASQKASDFEVAIADIGKVGTESLEQVRERVLSLDPSFATGTEFAKTYYQAISAGAAEGSAAMDLSITSIKAGEAAHVSSADTLVGLSKIISGYKGEVKSATEAADIMYGIEKAGQTTFSQLVPVIGNVASMTREAGLSANEMGGALALMTQTAGSTSQAATQLVAVSRELATPQKELAAAIKATGYESAGALIQQHGLAGGMKLLSDAAQKAGMNFNQLFSSQEAGAGAISLTADNFNKLKGSIDTVTNSTGAMEKASEEYGNTFEAKMDDMATVFDRIQVHIGEGLNTMMKPVIDIATTGLGYVVEGISYLSENPEWIGVLIDTFVFWEDVALGGFNKIVKASAYVGSVIPDDLKGIENAVDFVKVSWQSAIDAIMTKITKWSGSMSVFITRTETEWYSGIANISAAWNKMISWFQSALAGIMEKSASMADKIPLAGGIAKSIREGADALNQWSLERKTSAAIDEETAARLTENARQAVAAAEAKAQADNEAQAAIVAGNQKALLAEKEIREFRKVVKAERKEQGDFEAGIAEFEANANESSIKRQFGAIKEKDKAKKESADKSIKEIEREMEAYARLEKKMEEFTGKLSEETDAIYSDSGSDKTVQMIEKRRKEYEKLNAELKEQSGGSYQENADARVALEQWSVAQIYKSNKELNEKIEAELEASLGSRENAEKAKIDREYANYEKSLNAQIELLKNMGKTETDEYQALLTTKENAQKLHLAKLEKNEKDRLNRQRDFEIEYLKAVDPNNAALKQLESEKRESEIRDKYKGQDPVKVQQMIEADKADVARKEQEKLTADIQGMWKNMMSGISADATGAFALTGANISKMAGNLLAMASQQGKGDAAAGFSQLFSGQVKSGDPLSGLSAIGSQLSSGYKTLVESGTSIGNLVGDIDVGIKSFFGSASEGILSGVPWSSIASGALSLLSDGFSAKNIASTVASTAASIFLPGVGTLLAPVIGNLVGSLFGNEAGWGIGIDAKSVKWGGSTGKFGTHELERSRDDGGDESAKLVSEFQKQADSMLEPIYGVVGEFLEKLPKGAQAKADEILKNAEIEFDDVINWSQDGDQQTRTALNLSYIQTQAVKTAATAVNAANAEFAAGYDRSLIQTGSKLDKMLSTIGSGFQWQEAGYDLSEQDKIKFREAETKRFQEYLALNDQFISAMGAGKQLIAGIDAQLKPMTEYESGMAQLRTELESAQNQLIAIGYSESAIADVRAKSAELIAKAEAEYAKKRGEALADARESYELDGLTEYEQELKKINDDFAEREESLKQLGATESELIELSNIKAVAMQKEIDAYKAQREAIYAELDKLAGFTPDFGAFEAGIEDLNAKLIAYRDQLIAKGATPEEVQSATDKYVPAIQSKYQSDILSNSAKLAGRETEQTDYAAGAAKINAEFADMWKALQKSNGSVEQFVQLQEDYYAAMRNNAKAAQDTIDGVRDMAVEMAYGKKSVDLVTSATNTVNAQFAEFGKTVLKAGGDITALDALKSDAITRKIKESMFGDITGQTIANVLSSGVKTAVDNAANGMSTDFGALGKRLVTNINDTIRSDVANIEIGKTAELIYKNITDPILTGLAEKAKANGGIVSNEDIAKAMFPEDDPIAAKVMAYQAERTAIMQKATKNGNAETLTAELNALDARNTEAVQWIKDAASKPIELDEPKYELPEYDNTVDIAAPVYEMPEYSSVIKISAPTFEVSSTSVVSTSDRHSYAGGLIGVPEKEQHALIHEGELVITAPDAPKVWAYMQSQGMGRNYAKGKVPAAPSGALPKFENGLGAIGNFNFDSTQSSAVINPLITTATQQGEMQSLLMEYERGNQASLQAQSDMAKAIERLALKSVDALGKQQVTNEDFVRIKSDYIRLGGVFENYKTTDNGRVSADLQDMTRFINTQIVSKMGDIAKERRDAESKVVGDKLYDALKGNKDFADQFAQISTAKGGSVASDNKMAADIEKAKADVEKMFAPIREQLAKDVAKTFSDVGANTFVDTSSVKGEKYFDAFQADYEATQAAMIQSIRDKYAAELKAAQDNLDSYLKGLSGEKSAIDEVAAAKKSADTELKKLGQAIVDAGGAFDAASTQVTAYEAIEKKFADERDAIYTSAEERLSSLRGESTETVEKAVKAETKQWTDWYDAAKAKGASDKELTDLQTDAAEAIKLVTKATQDKIDADKLSAITSANDRYADLTGIIDYTSKKAKAIADETANWDKWIATAESSGASTAELTELRRKEAIAIDKVAENIDKEAMARENEAKSRITDQGKGLSENIADFQFGLNGKNKFEEKLKSWQGKTISTEDDLNAFVGDQIALYQDKFDKLADTYSGWEDVKKSASEAISAFDIEPIAESIREVPKRMDDSLTSVQDYISDMEQWAENAKQLRSDFVNLQSSIAESRAKIAADIGTAGMSKLDTLNSKIGSGMASLQALSPEEGLAKAQELRDLVMERYDEEKSQLESVTDSISKMKDMAETLRKKSDDLKYSDFNLTKGVARQDMMTQDYQSLLAKAKTGDASAVSDYTGFIDKYLQQSQQMYASSGQYTAIYSQVQSDLASLGAGITNQIPAQEAYLQSLNTVASETNVLLDQLSGYTEQQILSIDEGLSENKNAIELLLGDSSPIVMGQQQTVNAIGELKTVVNQNSQDNSAIMQALLAILNKDETVIANIDGDTILNIIVSKVNKAAENGLQLLNI